MVGAVLHRLDGGLDIGDRRNHDHLDEAVVLLDDFQHLEAVDPRQLDVEQDDIDVFAVEHSERSLAARDPQHAVLALENRGQRVANPFIVVDDEDCFRL
jgi:hypothetical protein